MKQTLEEFFKTIGESTETSVEKLSKIINKIRPKSISNIKESVAMMEEMVSHLEASPNLKETLSSEFNVWLIDSKISSNITSLGILSKQGFAEEMSSRFYNKFLPPAPKKVILLPCLPYFSLTKKTLCGLMLSMIPSGLSFGAYFYTIKLYM